MDLKREKNKSERRRNVSESETIGKAGNIIEKYNIKHRAVQNSTTFLTIKSYFFNKINIRSDLKIKISSIIG